MHMKEIEGEIKVGDTLEDFEGRVVTIERIERDDESDGGWKLFIAGPYAYKRRDFVRRVK
jgi:hypothetical protein